MMELNFYHFIYLYFSRLNLPKCFIYEKNDQVVKLVKICSVRWTGTRILLMGRQAELYAFNLVIPGSLRFEFRNYFSNLLLNLQVTNVDNSETSNEATNGGEKVSNI